MIQHEYALRARHQDLLREAEQARRSRQLAPRPRRLTHHFRRRLPATAPRPFRATGVR